MACRSYPIKNKCHPIDTPFLLFNRNSKTPVGGIITLLVLMICINGRLASQNDGMTVHPAIEEKTFQTLPTCIPTRPLPETPEELEAALKKWNVIPDVIEKTPPSSLKIEYIYTKVRYGNLLSPFMVTREPVWFNWTVELGSLYTLIMVDPDMPKPTAPSDRDFRHWIVGNIPGTHVHKGDTVSEYVGGTLALFGQGVHRYVFLVYKQPRSSPVMFEKCCGIITEEEFEISEDTHLQMIRNHTKFVTRDFVQKYKLGDPVAVNYFRIAWGKG
ncbi:protein D1-like [Bemisia tabaci]|uniref:protein D1-like n=1 Tax=Bemisia tabaci TaxID=7038 RepID=UPI003B284C3A